MPKSSNRSRLAFQRINTGSVVVGATPQALSSDTTALTEGVQLVASSSNAKKIFVGHKSNLTPGTSPETDGFPLRSGQSLLLPARSESDVYVVAEDAGHKIYFLSF